MRLKLLLLREVVQTKGARVENASVVLRWEVCVIPRLHRRLPELEKLNRFEARREHELPQLLVIHAHVLIVEEEVLLLLLLFVSLVEVFQQVLDQVVVYLDHVLAHPPIHQSFLL